MCLCLCTLLVTLTLDSASAQPVSKTETSASALHDKAKREQGPKIMAPKEQKDEVVKALAFLKDFEEVVLAKDYNQIAQLISSDFVKVMPGQPLTKKDIKFSSRSGSRSSPHPPPRHGALGTWEVRPHLILAHRAEDRAS